jgi:hypothetical protein
MGDGTRVVLEGNGNSPIYAHPVEYHYQYDGTVFDIRKLADLVEHFEAGTSEKEHISLIKLAECRDDFSRLILQAEVTHESQVS